MKAYPARFKDNLTPKVYKARTLIDGYKLGKMYAGKRLVAVPVNLAHRGNKIEYGSEWMFIKETPYPVTTKHKNKFGDGFYVLMYYDWVPDKEHQTELPF